ncbi:MAG: hypothetical protein HY684_03110 [Chloroflexi bacterium]|nr:hypothetical protein [Chloroflexota bacterium]
MTRRRGDTSPSRAAFLADESVPETVVQALKARGLDVVRLGRGAWDITTPVSGRDPRRDTVAWAGDRVFLTTDRHYLHRRGAPRQHGGIVVLSGVGGDERAVAQAVGRFLGAFGDARQGARAYRDRRFSWANDRLVEVLPDASQKAWSGRADRPLDPPAAAR